MKKQTHTPGPWFVSRLMATRVVSEVAPDDRILVATCDPVKGKQTDAEAEANARLIAASPDMARSLQRCLAALAANGAPNCEAAKEAKAALEKAGICD